MSVGETLNEDRDRKGLDRFAYHLGWIGQGMPRQRQEKIEARVPGEAYGGAFPGRLARRT